MSDGPGAIEYLAGELRRYGYRVHRYGNELRVRSRHALGEVGFSNGKFRTVVTDRDRCSTTIRFYQVERACVAVRPVVVKPGFGHGKGRDWGRGGWTRPVTTRPVFRSGFRWDNNRCNSGTTISFRW